MSDVTVLPQVEEGAAPDGLVNVLACDVHGILIRHALSTPMVADAMADRDGDLALSHHRGCPGRLTNTFFDGDCGHAVAVVVIP